MNDDFKLEFDSLAEDQHEAISSNLSDIIATFELTVEDAGLEARNRAISALKDVIARYSPEIVAALLIQEAVDNYAAYETHLDLVKELGLITGKPQQTTL
jgi:hypothetical protein